MENRFYHRSPALTIFLYLAVFAVFMLMTGFRLFADGMFLDGVTYAAISRNMAEGLGTFWEPHLSNTLFPQFHGHPPLALGLEGIAFRIFGDSLLVERFYSLGTFLITGYLIVLIWQELTGDKKSGWLPLLIWILFPLVSWAAASNLLDNTLGIFTTLAILLILKNSSRKQPFGLILAGISLFAGLLTKGPFALFPWVFPIIWAFNQPNFQFGKVVKNTLILVFFTLFPLIVLITLSTEARISLQAYWTDQLVGSFSGIRTVSSRFYILGILFVQLILPLSVATLGIWIYRKKIDIKKQAEYRKPAILLLLLGFCGVLPIMISSKQSSFYFLGAIPAFALAISLTVWALLRNPVVDLNVKKNGAGAFRVATILILIVSLVLPPVVAQHSGRDRKELAMIHDFNLVVPSGTTIRISSSLTADWSLYSNFARHTHISLDPSEDSSARFYLLLETDLPGNNTPPNWTRARQMNGFVLLNK